MNKVKLYSECIMKEVASRVCISPEQKLILSNI